MKTLLLFLAGLIVFALIVIGGGILFLVKINEERKATCGKCDFCDQSLQHCWMRGISVGMDDPACVTYQKKDKDEK